MQNLLSFYPRGTHTQGHFLGENHAAKRTADLPYSYHTLERRRRGRRRRRGSSPVPFRCYDCMWLHQLARPLKPRGGAIKESLAHSQHFSPSPPISSSLPFSYEVWSLSHSFDIPTNKAGRFSQGQSKNLAISPVSM